MSKERNDLFYNNCPVQILAYETENEAPHYHDSVLEVILCLKGNVTVVASHRKLDLSEGDIIVVNPHDIHYSFSSDSNTLVSFYFDLDNIVVAGYNDTNIKTSYFDCYKESLSVEQRKKMGRVMRILLSLLFFKQNEDKMQKSTFVTHQKHLSEELIRVLLDEFQLFFTPNISNPYSKELKARFERVMAYLMENYQDKITVAEISSMENINSNYFSQFFKKTTCIGVTKLLAFIRSHESEIFLLESDFDITDIAYECGFSDPKAYYKAFKEIYDNSPNQHRKHLLTLKEHAIALRYCELKKNSEITYYIALYNSIITGRE